MASFGLASAEVAAGGPGRELACCWHPVRMATETPRVIAILDFMTTSLFPSLLLSLPLGASSYVSLIWCEPFLDFNELLLRRQCGFPGFLAGFPSHVVHSEPDINLREEGRGRLPTGKDPDRIVGNLLQFAAHIENDGILFELNRG